MNKEHRPDPSPSQAACEWLIEALPQDALYEAVRGLGGEAGQLLPGFSVSRKALARPSVRKLLARSLANHPRLAGRICLAPKAPWQAWHAVLPMLDEEWLRANWRQLARHYGPPFAVAMALDQREALRNRGDRLLALDSFWSTPREQTPDTPESWQQLVRLLALAEAPPSPSPATDQGRVRELEQQCQQLRANIDKWKHKAKEHETAAANETERHSRDLRDLRQQLRAKDEEIAALHSGFDDRLRHQLAAFRERLLGPPPDAPANGSATLLERAKSAIERQRDLDERRGTRPQLLAELERLEELEKRLQRCMAESVVLVPDLPETTVQIGQRLREIRETLGELSTDTEAPDLAAALLWRLKNAHLGKQASEDLAQLHDVLELDLVREILGPKMHGRLRQLEKTRQDLTQEPTALDASLDASRPADVPVEREVWDLAAKLQQYPPASVWLFVDGYNAIRRVHDLHKLEQERGLAAARDRFCALCRRCAHQFGHFEIVFDGVESTAATESCAGLRIVYSRSAGESQNADEHLVRRLRALNGQPEVVWLVTDDFGLRERVINHCDAFVPPVLLYRFLTAHT